MNGNTINAAVTLGGSEGALLANRYRVVRQLGQGGMGSVWLAADTQLDNREVAIKMLPSILVSNKRAYNQLKSEALVSLKLTHPNIAAVRAFEENGGNPFLVVDYIDGQTLDDYLADISGRADLRVGRDGARPSQVALPESEVIRLLTPVAAALDYAHAKGVVHRDVKPANVMIAKDGTPYILDFGIAREIQETMTRVTGKLSSGTLMYMSPEQLHGAAPKSSQDVYSFAAMAYECLMGTPPFSRGQIEYQIEHDSPTPIDPQFAKCGPGVMMGLAKDPVARPASCAAVLSGGGRGATALLSGSRAGGVRALRPPRVHAPSLEIRFLIVALVLTAAFAVGTFVWWRHRDIAATNKRIADARIVAETETRMRFEQEQRSKAAERERREQVERDRREKAAETERVAQEKVAREKAEQARRGAEAKAKAEAARKAEEEGGKAEKVRLAERKVHIVRGADDIIPKALVNEKVGAPCERTTDEYIVQRGDTFAAIAYGHGITIKQLKELNGLSSCVARVGQRLKVPSASKATSPQAKMDEARKESSSMNQMDNGDPSKEKTSEEDCFAEAQVGLEWVRDTGETSEVKQRSKVLPYAASLRNPLAFREMLVVHHQLTENPKMVDVAKVPSDTIIGGMLRSLLNKEDELQRLRLTFADTHPEIALRLGRIESETAAIRCRARSELRSCVERYVAFWRLSVCRQRAIEQADPRGVTQKEVSEWRENFRQAEAWITVLRQQEPLLTRQAEAFWEKVPSNAFKNITEAQIEKERDPRALVPPITSGTETASERHKTMREVTIPLPSRAGSRARLDIGHGAALFLRACPKGTFTMGASESLRKATRRYYPPSKTVSVDYVFWIAETETTQRQWRRVMEGRDVPLEVAGLRDRIYTDKTVYGGLNSKSPGSKVYDRERSTLRQFYESNDNFSTYCGRASDDMPVYFVSWEDANLFCAQLMKLGTAGKIPLPQGYCYRLPTESEWEYACRAGCSADLPDGTEMRELSPDGQTDNPAIGRMAWYCGNSSFGMTAVGDRVPGWLLSKKRESGGNYYFAHAVGKLRTNSWGILDMLGNLWEWCLTYEDGKYVMRGGSWQSSAVMCLPVSNGWWPSGFRANHIGFRVVLAPAIKR